MCKKQSPSKLPEPSDGEIGPHYRESDRGNPLKVAIEFDDEWVFAMIQQMAVERGVSFASIVRRLCADGLRLHGRKRPKEEQ